ncbi:MAG: helix-turn-helix domain-containing protein [Acidithiobacillus ferrivorans]
MDARELVEAAKNRLNTSQTRLAKDLGISGASLSELAAGKKELSDETYIKLAKLAGVDPTEVIIEKHMKKAGPEGRVVWANLAKALPKKSAMIGLSVILLLPAPQSHANTPTTNIKSGGQVLIM